MLRKHYRRRGRHLSYPTVQTGTGPPPLSDIVWTQPAPLDPNARDATMVGWADPVGGIGPFVFFTNSAVYRMTSDGATRIQTFSSESGSIGQVRLYPGTVGPSTQSFAITCYDGRGDTVTKTVFVTKSVTSPILTVNSRRPVTQCSNDTYRSGPTFRPDMPGASTYGVTKADGTASIWSAPFGIIFTGGPGVLGSTIPVARYDLIVSARNSSGTIIGSTPLVFDVLPQPSTGYIEVNWNRTISTSTLALTTVARVAATTPNLIVDTWSMSDPSGLLGIYRSVESQRPAVGIVFIRSQPTTPGSYPFTITVQDDTYSYTQAFTLTVVAGVTIDQGQMTAYVSTSLTNATSSGIAANLSVAGITGTPIWEIVSQNNYSYQMEQGEYQATFAAIGDYGPRYSMSNVVKSGSTSTADVQINAILSEQTDTLVISCTDGINTCTAPLSIAVARAPVTIYWVGTGMSTAHPGIGYETLGAACNALFGAAHSDVRWLKIVAGSSPTKYDNDKPNGRSMIGPGVFEGVANGAVPMPGLGGYADLVTPGGWNALYSGKPAYVFGDGDWTIMNCEWRGGHGAAFTVSVDGFLWEGTSYGNLTVDRCVFHDNDQGIHTGNRHGTLIVTNCELYNHGTNIQGSGLQHGLYIGRVWQVFIDNVASYATNASHTFKCRAERGLITNCQFWIGDNNSGTSAIDLPDGGNHVIRNCFVGGDAMDQGPFIVNFAPESGGNGDSVQHVLLVDDCDIRNRKMSGGGNYGPVVGVGHFWRKNRGVYGGSSAVTVQNCRYSGDANSVLTYDVHDGVQSDPGATSTTTTSGNITTAVPAVLDTSVRPSGLAGALPVPGPLFRHGDFTDSRPPSINIKGVQPVSDRHFARFSGTAAIGTVAFRATAWKNTNTTGGPAIQFSSATAWSIIRDPTYNQNGYNYGDRWAPAGTFALTTDAAGVVTVLKNIATLAPDLYWIQLSAVDPNQANLTVYGRWAMEIT